MKLLLVCKVCGQSYLRYPSKIGPACSKKCTGRLANNGRLKMLEETAEARFWTRTTVNGECVEWSDRLHKTGYGYLKFGGKLQMAHRVAWKLKYGPIPDGLYVLHRCDNRPCVRVEHLFLGTQMDNVQDMLAKGRRQRSDGRHNSRALLSETEVAQVRALKGRVRQVDLAQKFGVHQTQISRILRGVSWKQR